MVAAEQHLVEVAPDALAERGSSADAAKRQRVAAAEDVVVLDHSDQFAKHVPFEAAAGVDRIERVDVGDGGEHAASRVALAIRALSLRIFGWTLAGAGITRRCALDARLDAASSDVSVHASNACAARASSTARVPT